jgi:hypothetical protein
MSSIKRRKYNIFFDVLRDRLTRLVPVPVQTVDRLLRDALRLQEL